MARITCPKCGSEELKQLAGNYPRAYECRSCGHVFVEGSKSLIDE